LRRSRRKHWSWKCRLTKSPPKEGGRKNFRPNLRPNYAEAIRQVKESVVKVSGVNGHGSGFVIHPGYILSNKHVTQDNAFTLEMDKEVPPALPFPFQIAPPPMNFKAANNPNYEIQMFTDDDRRPGRKFRAAPAQLADGSTAQWKDIALLRLPPNADYAAKPVAIGRPHAGQPVLVMGNPEDLVGMTTTGRVTKEVIFHSGEEMWDDVPFVGVDAGVNPGCSGGPTFGLRKENGKLKVELIAMSTYTYRGRDGMGGGIRGDFIAYTCAKRFGLPLMDTQQMEEFEKQFPKAK
jgi:S1-C subfamily serine protease